MATNRVQIDTRASLDKVWSAVRDIGALHTKLVPGFVIQTGVEPDGRVRLVTFANGRTLREPIVAIDDRQKRLVWTAEGSKYRHHNGAIEVIEIEGGMTRVIWTFDYLPDTLEPEVKAGMAAGARAMQVALDRLA